MCIDPFGALFDSKITSRRHLKCINNMSNVNE